MKLILECIEDTASVNIADRLRELADWKDTGTEFEGRPVLAHDDLRLATIEAMHITNEDLHERLPEPIARPDVVVFLSRHRAQSGTPSLTVHPIGNWADAPYGGREGTVVATDPGLMGGLLQHLGDNAPEGYEVSLEATHHGPYIAHPSVFLELGSSEAQWEDEDAARVLAAAMLEATTLDAPPVLWVGGGHYCPQLTDLVLDGTLAPGHVIPGWAANQDVDDDALRQAVDGVPGCAGFVLQRNAKVAERGIAERLEAMGVSRLNSDGTPTA